jgi:hypothetical protein
MAETLNINNLELADDSFKNIAADGDYRFKVVSHELSYYSGNSTKIPPNTQQIICHLEIPVMEDGELVVVSCRNTLNVYAKALFAIRNFTNCIALSSETRKTNIDLEKMDGLTGIGFFKLVESGGKDYTNLDTPYAPSKAPTVALNDEAWQKYNSEDVPFLTD